MPLYKTFDANRNKVVRYSWPAQYVTPTENINDDLRAWRKQLMQDRELLIQTQTSSNNDLREYFKEGASHFGNVHLEEQIRGLNKFLKEESNRCMKLIRAITLALPWFGDADKNQQPERPELWPTDLSTELDIIAARICVRHG